MKRILLIGGLSSLIFACGHSEPKQNVADATSSVVSAEETKQFFGDKITSEGAVSVNELKTLMGDKTELPVKLEATVDAVCQKKGCWMDLKTADGTPVRVTFKDYAFFVPKDASGKTAIVDGVAKVEETSVAELQEYAKDAGKSKEEISAITEPKKELVFEASGVILR